jgi:hypothetical protein
MALFMSLVDRATSGEKTPERLQFERQKELQNSLPEKIDAFIAKQEAELSRWGSKKYKQNNNSIEFEGDTPVKNGSMTIDISQETAGGTAIDVDFIVWGPYSSLAAACAGANPFPGNIGTGSSVVDCSYSPSATETATIPNAQVGQVYVMLLTNYSDQAGSITFSQTGGSGSADCSFTCGVNLTATPTACASNVYTLNGVLSATAGPGISVPNTGTVTITSSCGGSQTFNPPFTNVPYSFPGLTANGAACTVTATFSNFPNCNTVQQFTAPASCGPACAITSVTAVPAGVTR